MATWPRCEVGFSSGAACLGSPESADLSDVSVSGGVPGLTLLTPGAGCRLWLLRTLASGFRTRAPESGWARPGQHRQVAPDRMTVVRPGLRKVPGGTLPASPQPSGQAGPGAHEGQPVPGCAPDGTRTPSRSQEALLLRPSRRTPAKGPLREAPLLVSAVLGGIHDELRPALGGVRRVIKAQRAPVRVQDVLAVRNYGSRARPRRREKRPRPNLGLRTCRRASRALAARADYR